MLRRITTSFVCVLAAGCGTGDARTDGPTVRDSAGIRIVESPGPAIPPGTWTLGSEPRLSIGVVTGEPEYQFTQIQGVGALPGGGYWVAQLNNPPQIRIFDAGGRHVRSIGRTGRGPGELRGIAWAHRLGPDTLRVYDWWASRFTYFSLDGVMLREIPITTLGGRVGREISAQPGFAGGDILARSNLLIQRDAPRGLNRSTTFVLRVAPTGDLVDSFPPAPVVDYFGTEERNNMLPFARFTAFLAHDSLLYIATGDAHEIQVWAPGGRLAAIYRHPKPRRPVTPELIETERQRRLAEADDDNARRQVEQRLREVPFPELLPAYTRVMLMDEVGNLWAERYIAPGDTARVWDVFDPDGGYITQVSTPLAFEAREITGEEVIGIWTDDLDVETVRVYELRR